MPNALVRAALACALLLVPCACEGTLEDPGSEPSTDPGTDTGIGNSDSGNDSGGRDLCATQNDGDYCGSLIGGDASRLYHCKGKITASSEVCKDGCYDKPGPAGDACGSDAVDPCFNDPDGDYCGSAIGGDASTLYHCKGKHTESSDKCADGCWTSPPPIGGDACMSDSVDPCFNDPDGDYCGDTIGGPAGKLYHCRGKKTESVDACTDGCENLAGATDMCAGGLLCSHVQWWNSALTYGPYMSYGWWDTDLAVSTKTPVQLRHASRLDKHGVYGWGFMPEFTDLVTGKRFRFLHLQIAPSLQYANVDGKTYPAGFIVGLSGGDTAETGLGPYSTGAHLCVQTLDPYRDCFPTGKDACK